MSHFHSHAPATPAQTEGVLIRWASLYDLLTGVLTFGQGNRLRNLTLDLALLQPGERDGLRPSLLDVGCGTGSVALAAKQRSGAAGKVCGIDPAPEMIAVARRKAQQKKLEIDFRVGAIEALPFPDASFDVVTASLMVHHLPSDELQFKGFGEIYRVLKPGGRFLIADMIRGNSSGHLAALPALILHHGRQFDARAWLDMLQRAGFREAVQLEQRFLMVGFLRATK